MSPSLPPLPQGQSSGAPPSAPTGNGSGASPSAFAGGLPGMQSAIQQLEAGAQMLAQALPSLAPMVADFVSKLRMAIPAAMSAGAGGQGGQAPSGPDPSQQASLPSPPSQ